MAVVIMALIGAGAFITDHVGLSFGSLSHELLHVLEAVSISFFAVWVLLWLPFSRHKVQEAVFDEKNNRLQTRIDGLMDQEARMEREKKSGRFANNAWQAALRHCTPEASTFKK
jgi:hypothetical protein